MLSILQLEKLRFPLLRLCSRGAEMLAWLQVCVCVLVHACTCEHICSVLPEITARGWHR